MYEANRERYASMKYVRCGNSGLKLPEVSLGLWHNFGDHSSYENMKQMCFTAFDNGITHFDLANNYGPEPGSAERNFGKILRQELSAYRDEILVSTKAGYEMWEGPYGDGGSRKYLLASLDQSLQRLRLDYVDIFYHHRMDPQTPLEETMGALAQAVRSGKALYVGLSNYDGPTMERACRILDALQCPFVLNQNSYHIFNRTIEKNGLKAAAAKAGRGIISFSPLAQGMLTDRYLNGIPQDSRVRTDGRFLRDAGEAGANPGAERRGVPAWGKPGPDGAQMGAAGRNRDQRAHRRFPAAADSGESPGARQRALYTGRTGSHRRGSVGLSSFAGRVA